MEFDPMAEFMRRMDERRQREEPVTCTHEWGTAYKSASGRKVCVKCGHVTEAPFEALGVAEK